MAGNHKNQKSDKQLYRPTANEQGAVRRPGASKGTKKAKAGWLVTLQNWPFEKKRNIIVAVIMALAILAVIIAMLISLFGSGRNAQVSSLASSEASDTSDLDASGVAAHSAIENVVATEYTGTVLPQTEDAGQEYVDDTLFLGDSNTVRMLSYRDVTGVTQQNAIGVVGMGIQSVTSYKCVKYQGYTTLQTMPQAVAITQPRRVVINFGTNNVGSMAVATFIDYYSDAVQAVQASYPTCDVIISAVFPVDINCSASGITLAKIDAYNVALAALAQELGCKFLYWSEALQGSDGYALSNYTVSDGYHVSRDGMQALFNYFRTHAYITEDNRPKPLQAVPERLDADVDLITSDGNTQTVKGQETSMPQIQQEASTSSEVLQAATVTYVAGEGGYLSINGESSFVYSGTVGDTAPTVTAYANDGYEFSHWVSSVQVDTGATTVGGFTIAQTENTLTAVFALIEQTQEPTSQVESTQPQSEETPIASTESTVSEEAAQETEAVEATAE